MLTHTAGKGADIVTEGEAKVESKKGNEIKKNASEDDPAVVIERSGVRLSPPSLIRQLASGAADAGWI
jgi:hypothetical protein